MNLLSLALLLILVLYARSIRGGFLFDDHAITDMHFERWERSWKGKIYANRPARFRYALQTLVVEPRGLVHLGYFWTWRLAGRRLDPWMFHAVNMWIHQLNTVLVFLLAYQIRPSIAGIAALLFAVHPHQVAAVSYISGRASLQTTFFALAGVYFAYVGPSLSLWFLVPGIISTVFTQLSKEDGFLWIFLFGITFGVLRSYFGSI